MSNSLERLPKPSLEDFMALLISAGLSQFSELHLLPGSGNVVSGLFQQYLTPPMQRRTNVLLEGVLSDLEELKSQGRVSIEDIVKNEQFTTAVLQAVSISQRTTAEEKRALLRNAVVNTVLPSTLNDDLQAIFYNHIDRLTYGHIRMLKLHHDAPRWDWGNLTTRHVGHPKTELLKAHPDIVIEDYIELQYIRDLMSDGLILSYPLEEMGHIATRMPGRQETSFDGLYIAVSTAKGNPLQYGQSLATEIGDQFIDYVTSPLEGEKARVDEDE